MSTTKSVAVVIPIYEAQPEPNEVYVLYHFLKLYADYPVIFMTQMGLDVELYENAIRETGHRYASFERFEWKGYKQYINLLVSAEYYARFLKYEYILLAHLDAFAFGNDLESWCSKGYDYIGAVVYNQKFVGEYITSSRMLRILNKLGFIRKDPIQNGGFSLRKTKALYDNCRRFDWIIKNTAMVYLEDVFWCLRLPLINPFFRVAPTNIAKEFAIELPYASATNFKEVTDALGTMPLGCHGWKTFGFPFWKTHMEQHMQTEMVAVDYPEK